MRQFNPNYYKDEQEENKKRIEARKKELAKRKKEPRYISVQRDIVDWFKKLFKRSDKPVTNESEKEMLQWFHWFKDLFKPPPPERKRIFNDYEVDYY